MHVSATLRSRLFCSGLLAALVLRVAFGLIAIQGYEPGAGDPRDYVLLAEGINAGTGYALPWLFGSGAGESPPLRPTALRPPLYPLFLAGTFALAGRNLRAVVVAQGILDTLTCGLLGLTAAFLFGPTAAGLSVWWAGLYPAFWVHVPRIWSECLFIALSVALLYILTTARRASGPGSSWRAGLVLGLLCLTRPNGICFLPVVLLSGNAWRGLRQRLQAAALVMLVLSGVLLPWTVRNYVRMGRFVPLSTMEGAVVRGAYNDEALLNPTVRGGWYLAPVVAESEGATDEIELRDRFLRASRRWIEDHSGELPRLAVYRLRSFWSARWSTSEIHFLSRWPGLQAIERIFYHITLTFAVVGVWMSRRRLSEILPLLLVPLFFTAGAMLTWGNWRIRAPVEPVLVLLAVACFQRSRVCPAVGDARDRRRG